jgi:hypothetical protein
MGIETHIKRTEQSIKKINICEIVTLNSSPEIIKLLNLKLFYFIIFRFLIAFIKKMHSIGNKTNSVHYLTISIIGLSVPIRSIFF